MRIVLTGAAGFIGSTTSQHLLAQGHTVDGIDSISDYYSADRKRQNLERLEQERGFRFHQLDIVDDLIDPVLAGADAIIHLAGQPGVRRSWSEFDTYVAANVRGTKEVLDAAVRHGIQRVVYASSSSVYGNAGTYPTPENHPTSPQSPYAVTKLAGENLCTLYAKDRKLSTVNLRYFTVYGPRQRPDMLTHRLLEAAHLGTPVTIFGDGEQIRDFTYVDDIARANVLAATSDVRPGSRFNISGGSSVSVNEMIAAVERAAGGPIRLQYQGEASGDVHRTGGDCRAARRELGWEPVVSLRDGIWNHAAWYRSVFPAVTRVSVS